MTVIIPIIIYNNVKTSENSYLFFVMLVSVIATMITILGLLRQCFCNFIVHVLAWSIGRSCEAFLLFTFVLSCLSLIGHILVGQNFFQTQKWYHLTLSGVHFALSSLLSASSWEKNRPLFSCWEITVRYHQNQW